MMPAEHPELLETTFLGVKHYGSYGARDVLILVSTAPEGDDVVARKNGELIQQDKQRLTSEGIREDHWEDDAIMMKERYLKDSKYKSVNVEDCHMKKQYVLEKIISLLNNTTMPGGEKNKCMTCINDLYLVASNLFMLLCIWPTRAKHFSLVLFCLQWFSITLVLEEEIEETGVSVTASYHSET